VHEDTIAVAVARPGREAPQSWCEVASRPKEVAKLVGRLNGEFGGERLLFCEQSGQVS
jgi:hypothetical protein